MPLLPLAISDFLKKWWPAIAAGLLGAVLLWGRGEHGKVVRICNWARDLGFETPAGYCDD